MSESDNGATFWVMNPWPSPWPPVSPGQFYFQEIGDGRFWRLMGHVDGHIEIILVSGTGEILRSHHVQCIEAPPNTRAIVAFMWTLETIEFYINGRPLEQFRDDAAVFVIDSKSQPLSPLSIENPDANQACHHWIEWRKRRFPQLKNQKVKSNRRVKTDFEEIEDLRRSLASLRLLLERSKDNDLFLAGHLAAELRALVYWVKDDDRSYNPLLLRIANKAHLPLPVYGFRELIPLPSNIPIPRLHLVGNGLTLTKSAPKHELMDLQDWLLTEAIQLNVFSLPDRSRSITNAVFISEAANTLGCAHYDEDTSEFFDEMFKMGTNVEAYYSYLFHIADGVSVLCEWVLFKLQQAGIGGS